MEKFSSFQSALESWAQLTQMNTQIQIHNNNSNDMRIILFMKKVSLEWVDASEMGL